MQQVRSMVYSMVRSRVRAVARSSVCSMAACGQKAITYDDQRFASSDLHRWTRRIKGFQNMTLTPNSFLEMSQKTTI